jgi:Flp pilus assembly protein protease CpaA
MKANMNTFLVFIPLIILLGIATYTDLQSRVIPDKLSIIGLSYFLILRLFYNDQSYVHYLLGVIIGAGLLYIFAVIIPNSFGGGDIKLMSVVGMALGWQLILLFLIIMLAFALLYALGLKWAGYTKKSIPLAPFCLAAMLMLTVILLGYLV